MELAYLGLFEKVFNWIMDRIFEPIFQWLSGLLSTVFTWIFNNILSPILLPILETVMNFMFDLIMQIWGNILYSIFAGILKLIDYMEIALDIFIGIRDVTYYPDPTNKNIYINGSLIEVLLQQENVSTVFWLITIAGIAIAMMLTIFGTAKSAFDLDFDNKRPVSKVLTEMMKAFIQFFTVPFFVYFMLMLAAEILKTATRAITGDFSTTLGRIVFIVASLNAAKTPQYNVNYKQVNVSDPAPLKDFGSSINDPVRFSFYITEKVGNIDPKDYSDVELVGSLFDFVKFDYLIGGLAAVFLLFVMAVCMITFVKRLFEIILLYMVSPYFVSTMPIDDGERFGRWREMFIGKCFTGFGSAIGMRLYLLVCQIIMGNTIQFTTTTMGNSIEMDYIMKLFFLVGGAWAVFKSGPMITSLISSGAGSQESMTQAAAGAMYGHALQKVGNLGKGALAMAFRGKSKEKAEANDKANKNNDPDQKFNGSKNDNAAKNDNGSGSDLKKSAVSVNTKPGESGSGAQGKKNKAAATAGAQKAKQPKEHKNIKIGSLYKSTFDENGNRKIRVLGFGVDKDAKGNTTGVKMPIFNMKFQRTGANESMKLAKMNIPGISTVSSNIKDGKLEYSDISILGGLGRFNRDEDGSHTSILGMKSHQFADGSTGKDIAMFHTRSNSVGTAFAIGSSFGISKNYDGNQVQSFKLGSLEYSRTGIMKQSQAASSVSVQPTQSSVSASAPKVTVQTQQSAQQTVTASAPKVTVQTQQSTQQTVTASAPKVTVQTQQPAQQTVTAAAPKVTVQAPQQVQQQAPQQAPQPTQTINVSVKPTVTPTTKKTDDGTKTGKG